MTERWFPIQVDSGRQMTRGREMVDRERIACDALVDAGFWAYLPLEHRRVVACGRPHVITRPLYPGYLFAWFDPDDADRWTALRRAKHVGGVLSVGSGIIAVPDRDIVRVERFERERRLSDPGAVPLFEAGQLVVVDETTGTPIVGRVKTTMIIKGKPRLIVEVSMFNRAVDMKVDQRRVVRAS